MMRAARTTALATTLVLATVLGLSLTSQASALTPVSPAFAPHGAADLVAPVQYSPWRNEGAPYFFENCWWQNQRAYKGDRPTRATRIRKVSCPDLNNFRARDIVKPGIRLKLKP